MNQSFDETSASTSSEATAHEGRKQDIPLYTDFDPSSLKGAAKSFDELEMDERVRAAIAAIGWKEPTPVQQLCLPHTLKGKDVAGFAQTGTGKTGVFLITIAQRLLTAPDHDEKKKKTPGAIVIAPTRELAMQIEQDARPILEKAGLASLAVFGGIDYEKQARMIREGVDVLVATPGRLKDYTKKKVINLENIAVFVCDEADRMFDMGFIEDVEFFLERIPEKSQRLLFSATTNEQVKELAFEYLESPEYISVNPEVITPEAIDQHAVHCHATNKLRVLLGMLRDHAPDCAIVFTNTKLTAEWVHYKLIHNGIDADLITGDLPQKKRIRLIQRIKEGKLKALVATDVASRGLHISRVTHVYNFDLPDEPANYIHRIGRTARAGAKGSAFSLVCDDYGQNLAEINDLLGNGGLKSEWFDESYLQIEDKAGNPFTEGAIGRNRSDGPGQDRGDRDRGRRKGAKGPHRSAKADGEKGSDDRATGRSGQKGGGRSGTRGSRRGSHEQQQQRNKQGKGPGKGKGRRQGHKTIETGRSGRPQTQRQDRLDRRRPKPPPKDLSATATHKKLETTVEETPKSFVGLIKKLTKTIFGKK